MFTHNICFVEKSKKINCQDILLLKRYSQYTVNSEVFARTLFSHNFAYAKFRGNKTLVK